MITSPGAPTPIGTSTLLSRGLITPSAIIPKISMVITCFAKSLIKGISCHCLLTPSKVDTNGALCTVSVSPRSGSIPIASLTKLSTLAIMSGESGCGTSNPVSGSTVIPSFKRTDALIFVIKALGFKVVEIRLLTS